MNRMGTVDPGPWQGSTCNLGFYACVHPHLPDSDRRLPRRAGRFVMMCIALSLVAARGGLMAADDLTAENQPVTLDFVRLNVIPLLESRCFECHGPDVEHPKGGLRLSSVASMLRGGDSGPAIVRGKAAESLLIQSINYENFEMPPRSKLPDGEIEILTRWINSSVPWPDRPSDHSDPAASEFPLAERVKSHWAWRPIQTPPVPKIRNAAWPVADLDRFILSKLEAAGIAPAPRADRRTLVRRLYFDLIGLPPTPAQADAFIGMSQPDHVAVRMLVDELLQSPHFGERWARHWLDLVRYADTLGHEFDYPLHNAFEYRDYVIRALNADVPYDQFVTEHIAGDLIENPRVHPTDRFNESLIGTGFWFLGEDKHAPVDVRAEEAARIDNQIDVFSKTFLGLTVACARCHDHKFDAISTRDYYALAGFLQSSRRQIGLLDPHDRIRASAKQLADLHGAYGRSLRTVFAQQCQLDGKDFAAHLLAASIGKAHAAGSPAASTEGASEPSVNNETSGAGAEDDLRLAGALQSDELKKWSHPLSGWVRLVELLQAAPETPFETAFALTKAPIERRAQRAERVANASELIANFNGPDFGAWRSTGDAFGSAPTQSGEWDATSDGLKTLPAGLAHSGRYSRKLCGVLRSPTFELTHPRLVYRLAGENAKIRLVIDGYVMNEFSALLFKGAAFDVNTEGHFRWHVQEQDVSRYLGHRVHIELVDDGDGWVAVDEIRFSAGEVPAPVDPPCEITDHIVADPSPTSIDEFVSRYATEWDRARDAYAGGTASNDQRLLVEWAAANGFFAVGSDTDEDRHARDEFRQLADSVPFPRRVIAMTDGSGEDEHVFIRGNHRNLGDVAPRRFLAALSPDQQLIEQGSGRLALARRLLDSDNPFPARVAVNRIWHHLIGRGIVPSVDNFGVLGQPPSHPELLDHLASRLIAERWSVKSMIREIVLSATYQTDSHPTAATDRSDPANALVSRARIRRLEGEVIRDALLLISGDLNSDRFGPGVPVHLTDFMQGRGRPGTSGPLNGHGRRSIYQEVRRNFMSPLMLAFDSPTPFTSIGQRTVSNVPAQALILLNSPFVIEQAGRWAQRTLSDKLITDPRTRVDQLYRTAFARPAGEREIDTALEFLARQATGSDVEHNRAANDDVELWADLCHALINSKEFIYIK